MKLAILISLIQLINAFPKWDTPSTPRWRRDAEAERHRVAGNCKFYMMKSDVSPSFHPNCIIHNRIKICFQLLQIYSTDSASFWISETHPKRVMVLSPDHIHFYHVTPGALL